MGFTKGPADITHHLALSLLHPLQLCYHIKYEDGDEEDITEKE